MKTGRKFHPRPEGLIRIYTRDGLGARSPLALRQHGAGLLAGAGVDEVIAEENLRGRSAGSIVLGHVVRADVDGIGARLLDHLDYRGLAVPRE